MQYKGFLHPIKLPYGLGRPLSSRPPSPKRTARCHCNAFSPLARISVAKAITPQLKQLHALIPYHIDTGDFLRSIILTSFNFFPSMHHPLSIADQLVSSIHNLAILALTTPPSPPLLPTSFISQHPNTILLATATAFAISVPLGTLLYVGVRFAWENIEPWMFKSSFSFSTTEPRSIYGVDITGSRYFNSPNVLKAVEFAADAHRGQIRKTGDPYVVHCIETAKIVESLLSPAEDDIRAEAAIITALLHDVLDDAGIKTKEIQRDFGDQICSMVSKVSQLSATNQLVRRRLRLSEEEPTGEEETLLHHMILTMVSEPLAILVKLADRLHNMRTVYALKPEKQKAVAEETRRVWCSLAERLGLFALKSELEDLCFAVLQPNEYRALRAELDNLCGVQSIPSISIEDCCLTGECECNVDSDGMFHMNNSKEHDDGSVERNRGLSSNAGNGKRGPTTWLGSADVLIPQSTTASLTSLPVESSGGPQVKPPSPPPTTTTTNQTRVLSTNPTPMSTPDAFVPGDPAESLLSPEQRLTRDLIFSVLPFDASTFNMERLNIPPSARRGLEVLQGCARALLQEITTEGLGDGLDVEVQGRVKSLYSSFKKMARKGVPLTQVYDARALRVVVDDEYGTRERDAIAVCYKILPAVHRLWRRVYGEDDDYIAMPKKSGYQSLHTAVIGPGGVPMEVQIRTWSMHEMAEYGAAAHWAYKERPNDAASVSGGAGAVGETRQGKTAANHADDKDGGGRGGGEGALSLYSMPLFEGNGSSGSSSSEEEEDASFIAHKQIDPKSTLTAGTERRELPSHYQDHLGDAGDGDGEDGSAATDHDTLLMHPPSAQDIPSHDAPLPSSIVPGHPILAISPGGELRDGVVVESNAQGLRLLVAISLTSRRFASTQATEASKEEYEELWRYVEEECGYFMAGQGDMRVKLEQYTLCSDGKYHRLDQFGHKLPHVVVPLRIQLLKSSVVSSPLYETCPSETEGEHGDMDHDARTVTVGDVGRQGSGNSMGDAAATSSTGSVGTARPGTNNSATRPITTTDDAIACLGSGKVVIHTGTSINTGTSTKKTAPFFDGTTDEYMVERIRFLRSMIEWGASIKSGNGPDTSATAMSSTSPVSGNAAGEEIAPPVTESMRRKEGGFVGQSQEVMVLIWPAGKILRVPRGTTAGDIMKREDIVALLRQQQEKERTRKYVANSRYRRQGATKSKKGFGNTKSGSKLMNVNNQLVAYDTVLQDGDYVVLTQETVKV